jgi:hypothetical protein
MVPAQAIWEELIQPEVSVTSKSYLSHELDQSWSSGVDDLAKGRAANVALHG